MASPERLEVVDGFNTSMKDIGNGTRADMSTLEMILSYRHLVLVQSQLVLSSMGIIFLVAHAALRRPPSAAPPRSKSTGKRKKEQEHLVEGLQATDALMFPLFAGAMLVGLYYLIKWLEDPSILNKIIQFYISGCSVASFGKLFSDTLQLLLSLVFPSVWRDQTGQVFRIDPVKQCQWRLDSTGGPQTQTLDERKTTPFPDSLARWTRVLRLDLGSHWWTIRRLLKQEWTFKIAVYGMGRDELDVTVAGVMGIAAAACLSVVYHFATLPIINNLMGLGLCYGALMLMSCTSFAIGSIVLMGLFVYDIVMVFYTPYMVTVATTLDAPIKLVFATSTGASMLGLGDIVIPGMYICLSLRFDLWKHYQNQIRYEQAELKTETSTDGTKSTSTVATIEVANKSVKADYVSPQGRWGDRFWTLSWRTARADTKPTAGLRAAAFSKAYFYTAMTGYAVGMLVTLGVVLVFKQGQPALLYLVPGVLLSTWGRGLLKGQLKDMWTYTEDGTLDTKDVVVEVDAAGNVHVEKKDSKATKDEELKTKEDTGVADKGRIDEKRAGEETTDIDRNPREAKMKHTCSAVLSLSLHVPEAGENDDDYD